ncbi:putative bifunctional diguanylate cyclase/phosphodiesterase [Pantanalinema sp. GBBB05]|uniref:putative bifunctional diguanylate cyclase/phosphodiesterase n=1 Tax=Pantanalinema sp. GBBB05 TaxID=2604139 RepID=UPI001E161E54|nr:EAL domain-containing protein [Pantanalinema sp. GBBB05]
MTRILVIEDDSTVQSLILKLLQAEGFTTISSSDGRSGIVMAQQHEPDLIICDIMMPECNGYEVLETLREYPTTARIPFIFLSAKADRAALRQGMELGADDYLTKPFTRAELLGAIAARLDKQASITQPYIDEMKRAARSLNQLAYRDPLTNLPNRILLHHQMQELLLEAGRSRQLIAVMYLNLNRFKAVNLNLGYSGGDQLLQTVADRLRQLFPTEGQIARLSGDEFGLLLTHASNQEAVAEFAKRVLVFLAEPYELFDQYVQIHGSLGIALFPQDGNTPDTLLSRADTAMRQAKTLGGSQYAFYDVQMDLQISERRMIESRLRSAQSNQELELHYQPQVNLVTGRIIGAEALLRWKQADLGTVSPAKFIPVAEETGLIVSIGEWVLRTACIQAQSWQNASQMPIRVSVNLSARQFKQANLSGMVAQVLRETQLDPTLLVIELTETSVMEDVETTISILQELKRMGVQISIDDFGTGYSSLNYLKRFPIDVLKIDQSFVQDITTDTNDAAIAKAIIAMAQSLQLKVIAEGVETQEQYEFLRHNGCNAMQGYLFSRPLSSSDFVALLNSDKRLQMMR